MESMTTIELGRGPYTRADLEAFPDDGRRYELLDGALLVSPAPGFNHQTMVLELAVALREVLPDGLTVLVAPFAVALAEDTELQPDVLVAPRQAFTARELVGPPLLAVEVLSPSTRSNDLVGKKARLERAGCEHYWVVDPEVPSIICWRLVDGAYREVASAEGEGVVELDEPFAVRLSPADLVE